MMDYFVSLLLKAAESFVTSLMSKLAERLAASKKMKTQKKPSPRRREQKRERSITNRDCRLNTILAGEFPLFGYLLCTHNSILNWQNARKSHSMGIHGHPFRA